MVFDLDPEIQKEINRIVLNLDFTHIEPGKCICFKSYGSKSRAIARIWSLPKIWQIGLNIPAHYCIEVVSEKFDRLSKDDKEKVLIHELLHIPKNFSGALLPHRQRSKKIDRRTVESWFSKLYKNK